MDSLPARLKQRVPFGTRFRARKLVDAVVFFPRDQASFSLGAVGPLHHRYRAWYWRRHLRRFFAPLLRPGDLVFDVGANVGVWTWGLASLGCRVIAVEPQPLLAARIRDAIPRGAAVEVVAAAVGVEAGEADLFLTSIDSLATTSRSWVDRMVECGGIPADFWSESIRVSVRTLDDLIEEFGVPAYVKLDVEGGEFDAVSGLTRPLDLISFESHGQTVDDSRRIVTRLLELGDYEFNLSPGEFQRLSYGHWCTSDQILAALEESPWGWHNVFARRRPL